MNEVWNLDPIYATFDDPAFAADMDELKAQVEGFTAFTQALAETAPIDGLRLGIAYEEKLTSLVNKLVEYASLRQSADTRDAEAGSRFGQILALYSAVAAPDAAFRDWASKLPGLMELVKGDEELRDYEFLFANMADSARYLLPGRGEEIMAKLSLSGGNAWSDLQQ